jgi:P27 family predicted phage terminase small subunit
MKGRKPLPSVLKQGHGDGKRKPMVKAPAGEPVPPPFLSDEALAEWKRITAELRSLGVLSSIDRAALAGYCRTWERVAKLTEQSNGEPATVLGAKGGPIENPAYAILRRENAAMLRWLVEFGLTPSSRSRIHAGTGANEDDPLVKLYEARAARNGEF